MEGLGGGRGGGGDGSMNDSQMTQKLHEFWRIYQYYLDKTTPHAVPRWVGTLILALIYGIRVYFVQGFYIITYALGIYLLNLLIGFLSPLVDPELEPSDGPLLPTKGSDEFKPFIRRLPEFKFWCVSVCVDGWWVEKWVRVWALLWGCGGRLTNLHSITKAFSIAFMMTFFSVFDVPVFWPILLVYWIVLFTLTMKRQIAHMIKYRYIPFSLGKQKYGGKKKYAASTSGSRAD
ncbi:hypothetical protein KSS87_016553 [Heliosperma pusillum]|nr:hypothetical protein KSS87_016553 [Heliosperma pusillum]